MRHGAVKSRQRRIEYRLEAEGSLLEHRLIARFQIRIEPAAEHMHIVAVPRQRRRRLHYSRIVAEAVATDEGDARWAHPGAAAARPRNVRQASCARLLSFHPKARANI